MLSGISVGFAKGADAFSLVSPSMTGVVNLKWVKRLLQVRKAVSVVAPALKKEKTIGEIVGEGLAANLLYKINAATILKQKLNEAHLVNPKRTWFTKPGRMQFVVVYHDAYKAQKHLDIHFQNGTSFIIRVSGKPVEYRIKYNAEGKLTETSKLALLDHVREEISNSSRVPQNLDHSPSQAQMSWKFGKGPKDGYGSGNTRQVILKSECQLLKLSNTAGQTAEMYIPKIDPDNLLYIHKLYPGDGKTSPIAIWGKLKPDYPEFKDRLHLTLIQPDEFDRFKELTDSSTTTRKYDGASCYINVTDKKTTIWSPRESVKTGKRIEYTGKVPELANLKNEANPKGMGELLFRRKYFGIKGPYLPSTDIGGILNSNSLRPKNVVPEIRLYRIDKWNGKDVSELPFFENRELQHSLSHSDMSKALKVVSLTKPVIKKQWEGLVAVPLGKSINEGIKIKWLQDAADWVVTKPSFRLSDKGNIQGVVWFKSLQSGKTFKLGPGQFGKFDDCMDVIDHPDSYVGKVAKVVSHNGHEGRAAKLQEWHLDKGIN